MSGKNNNNSGNDFLEKLQGMVNEFYNENSIIELAKLVSNYKKNKTALQEEAKGLESDAKKKSADYFSALNSFASEYGSICSLQTDETDETFIDAWRACTAPLESLIIFYKDKLFSPSCDQLTLSREYSQKKLSFSRAPKILKKIKELDILINELLDQITESVNPEVKGDFSELKSLFNEAHYLENSLSFLNSLDFVNLEAIQPYLKVISTTLQRVSDLRKSSKIDFDSPERNSSCKTLQPNSQIAQVTPKELSVLDRLESLRKKFLKARSIRDLQAPLEEYRASKDELKLASELLSKEKDKKSAQRYFPLFNSFIEEYNFYDSIIEKHNLYDSINKDNLDKIFSNICKAYLSDCEVKSRVWLNSMHLHFVNKGKIENDPKNNEYSRAKISLNDKLKVLKIINPLKDKIDKAFKSLTKDLNLEVEQILHELDVIRPDALELKKLTDSLPKSSSKNEDVIKFKDSIQTTLDKILHSPEYITNLKELLRKEQEAFKNTVGNYAHLEDYIEEVKDAYQEYRNWLLSINSVDEMDNIGQMYHGQREDIEGRYSSLKEIPNTNHKEDSATEHKNSPSPKLSLNKIKSPIISTSVNQRLERMAKDFSQAAAETNLEKLLELIEEFRKNQLKLKDDFNKEDKDKPLLEKKMVFGYMGAFQTISKEYEFLAFLKEKEDNKEFTEQFGTVWEYYLDTSNFEMTLIAYVKELLDPRRLSIMITSAPHNTKKTFENITEATNKYNASKDFLNKHFDNMISVYNCNIFFQRDLESIANYSNIENILEDLDSLKLLSANFQTLTDSLPDGDYKNSVLATLKKVTFEEKDHEKRKELLQSAFDRYQTSCQKNEDNVDYIKAIQEAFEKYKFDLINSTSMDILNTITESYQHNLEAINSRFKIGKQNLETNLEVPPTVLEINNAATTPKKFEDQTLPTIIEDKNNFIKPVKISSSEKLKEETPLSKKLIKSSTPISTRLLSASLLVSPTKLSSNVNKASMELPQELINAQTPFKILSPYLAPMTTQSSTSPVGSNLTPPASPNFSPLKPDIEQFVSSSKVNSPIEKAKIPPVISINEVKVDLEPSPLKPEDMANNASTNPPLPKNEISSEPVEKKNRYQVEIDKLLVEIKNKANKYQDMKTLLLEFLEKEAVKTHIKKKTKDLIDAVDKLDPTSHAVASMTLLKTLSLLMNPEDEKIKKSYQQYSQDLAKSMPNNLKAQLVSVAMFVLGAAILSVGVLISTATLGGGAVLGAATTTTGASLMLLGGLSLFSESRKQVRSRNIQEMTKDIDGLTAAMLKP